MRNPTKGLPLEIQLLLVFYFIIISADVPLSPTSSLHSGGPEVPSAPVSPWNSDFYESEFEPELREITLRSLARPPRNRSKSDRHSLGEGEGEGTSLEAQWKAGSYFTLPATNKSPNVASFFGENPAKMDVRQGNSQPPKDLFELASRRRANRDGDLVSGASSLIGEGMEKVRPPRKLEENLGFNVGKNEQEGKFSKETSSVYSR